MALFQNSILRNHLQNIDSREAFHAFEVYKKAFLPKIANIKTSKEEQYQYGFLDDLFVKVLGYTLNPTPNFNLIAEQKNLSDSKKADGAVLKDGKVIAVIELKSTKTKFMDKIVNQAFNYKHNHPMCKYIITSNFEKLRLYVEHSDSYEEFNLFELDEQRFTLLYTLLSKESMFADVALTLKSQSKLQEENISNELYKKYAELRTILFNNIVHNNPEIDKYILLEKTQTILDRMVFIFFAEARGILPPNTIRAIIDHYKGDIEDRELWHFYKIYFKAINVGNQKLNIPEYNGGLFATDDLLNSLKIDNDVIEACPLALSAYDFNSDIDVNILGHIFENSLNDIEELKARIEDEDFDVKQSKRKKDGVFYTPEYITKYIIDNTLGALCQAKKEELGLDEVDILIPKNPKKLNKGETKQKEALEAYREYLLGLKILDPACGSGAFLNQALNYLLEEHDFIDESIKTLMGGSVLGLYDVKKGILENNLYGVDINAEAVEIAKLSLWLRTVESGRKLNKLADKIKVGNSLIDDKSVSDDAFVWEEEFEEVFEQGGFDVVIGNPPYGATISKKQFKYFQNFTTASYKLDTFSLFTEISMKLTKINGVVGLIVPYTWLTIQQHQKLRDYLLKYSILQIVDLPTKVFEDADLDTTVLLVNKINLQQKHKISIYTVEHNNMYFKHNIETDNILKNNDLQINISLTNDDYIILNKLKNHDIVGNIFKVSQGLIPYDKQRGHSQETIKNRIWHNNYQKDNTYKKELKGSDLTRYYVEWNGSLWISYGDWLASPRKQYFFTSPRVLVMEITRGDKYKIKACYIEKEFYNTPSIINIIEPNNEIDKLKYFLSVFNSRLFSWYHLKANPKANATTSIPKILINDIRKTPYKNIDKENQQVFIEKSELMMALNKTFQIKKTKFLKRVKDNFNLEKLSKKLEAFYEHDFKALLAELKKKKVKLTLIEQDEWEEYFEAYQKELLEIKANIDTTDKQIDEMVYELYGLSEDEVAVVEGRV